MEMRTPVRGGAMTRPRAIASLVLGVLILPVGIGLGLMHAIKGDWSIRGVVGVVLLAAGVGATAVSTVWLVKRARRWWKLLALPIAFVAVELYLLPVTAAVYATHVPHADLGAQRPDDLDMTYEVASLRTSDGVRLAAWYAPSHNGAAVVLLHGAGSTRTAVLHHAAVLAGHGYGVLMFDARGHGESGGTAMDFGWFGDRDTRAAVDFLTRRSDVDPARIGAVGLSMGGEEAITAAASDARIQAVVGEGVEARVARDDDRLPRDLSGWTERVMDRIQYGVADLLTDASPPMPLREAVRKVAPRPVLIVASGDKAESGQARYYRAAAPASVTVWEVPDAHHTKALARHPKAWESRVIAFLDRSLVR
jgi:alpha-beta hydrolase superfamily lysophospholipase